MPSRLVHGLPGRVPLFAVLVIDTIFIHSTLGTNLSERFRSDAFLPAHRLARSLIFLQDVARNVIPAYVRCPAALLTACSVV